MTGSSVIVNNVAAQFSPDEMVLLGEKPTKSHSEVWPDKNPCIYYIDPNFTIGGRGTRYLRWLNFNRCFKQAKDIVKREGVTHVLAIFPDDFYLYLAFRLSNHFDLPFYTWFHNTYLDNYSGIRKRLAAYLQPRVWRKAKKNWVMSDGMLHFYQQKYPGVAFSTLRHGFPLQVPEYKAINFQKDRLSFVFTGSLNASCEDAALRMMRHILQYPNFDLHVYTGSSLEYFERQGISGDQFHHHGFIPLEELYQALRQYDIMLLPHGFDGKRTDVEFQTIFPTRTIPLLLSNRPILAHSPPNVFLTNFLLKNDCALVVNQKEDQELDLAIKTLIENDDRRAELIQNALRTAEQFDISVTTAQIQAEIYSYAHP